MTCVIGIKNNNKIYIGADSLAIAGQLKYNRKDKKIFYVGNILFGTAGTARSAQLLEYNLNIPQHSKGNDFKYLCTKLVPAIRKVFIDGGAIGSDRGIEKFDGEIIVAYNNNLYYIHGDFQIGNVVENYLVIGSGAEIALGSLFNDNFCKKDIVPKLQLLNALEASEKYTTTVGRPFYYFVLGDKKIKKLKGVDE